MSAPGHTALGAWSGGRYITSASRSTTTASCACCGPDEAIHTVVTADV